MSQDVGKATNTLRKFMFENVYLSKKQNLKRLKRSI